MGTLRVFLAAICCLALLGGLSTGALAQPEVGDGVWVTLESEECMLGANESHTGGSGEGFTWDRDFELDCAVTWSDPRVSGTRKTFYNDNCFVEYPCAYWGTQDVIGPDGTWTGTYTGLADPNRAGTAHGVLVGTGAYDGLTFVWYSAGEFDQPPSGHGLIYEGDAPLTPAE